MGFIEFYRKKHKSHRFFTLKELPDEVKKDLQNLLDNNDKRIGFFVSTTFEIRNGEKCNTKVGVSYYVRTHFPDIIFNDYHIPVGIRFWRMFKVATADGGWLI